MYAKKCKMLYIEVVYHFAYPPVRYTIQSVVPDNIH